MHAIRTQIKLVAELLLEKETINHDDLVSLIGARPFKAHKSYLEFISANEDAKQKMADSKDEEAASAAAKDTATEETAKSGGGDGASATGEGEGGEGTSGSAAASSSKP